MEEKISYKKSSDKKSLIDSLGNEYPIIQDYNEMLQMMKDKKPIVHFEYGDSMKPLLLNGEYCLVVPLKENYIPKQGDAVFCSVGEDSDVGGSLMVHMVWLTANRNGEQWVLIGSSMGYMFGWTNKIYGLAFSTDVYEKE